MQAVGASRHDDKNDPPAHVVVAHRWLGRVRNGPREYLQIISSFTQYVSTDEIKSEI